MINKRISRNKKTKHTGGSSPQSLKSLKSELQIEMAKIDKPPYSNVRNDALYVQGEQRMFGPNPDLGTDPASKELAQKIVDLKTLIHKKEQLITQSTTGRRRLIQITALGLNKKTRKKSKKGKSAKKAKKAKKAKRSKK
jgi:hypothetical protein